MNPPELHKSLNFEKVGDLFHKTGAAWGRPLAFLSSDSCSPSFLHYFDDQESQERNETKNRKKGRPGDDPLQLLLIGIGHHFLKKLAI